MPNLFLSYSRDDRIFKNVLSENLRRLGFNLWIDEEHLEVGTPQWQAAIEQAIEQVDAMVVILTPSAKASSWVNNEILYAQECRKRIFPVLAAGDKRTAVPLALKSTQYADMTGRADYEAGFRGLVGSLATHSKMTVSEFSLAFSGPGQARVQVHVHGHNEGTIVAVGGAVEGTLTVAGESVDLAPQAPPPPPFDPARALAEAAPPKPRRKPRPASPKPQPAPVEGVEPKPEPSLPDVLRILPPPFEWIAIPAGEVRLEKGGYVPKGGQTYPVERFWIAKHPLTNAQFQVFVEAADGYGQAGWWDYSEGTRAWRKERTQPSEAPWGGPPDHPRVRVAWHEAVAFCRWLTARIRAELPPGSAYEVRLPTEQEWQRAAQGDNGREYPWGNQPPDDTCCNWGHRVGRTTPVGSYPAGASPYGVLDMAGNVWEWCLTDWDTGSNDIARAAQSRALRGGSWLDDGVSVRAAGRDWGNPAGENGSSGFRCARSS